MASTPITIDWVDEEVQELLAWDQIREIATIMHHSVRLVFISFSYVVGHLVVAI